MSFQECFDKAPGVDLLQEDLFLSEDDENVTEVSETKEKFIADNQTEKKVIEPGKPRFFETIKDNDRCGEVGQLKSLAEKMKRTEELAACKEKCM